MTDQPFLTVADINDRMKPYFDASREKMALDLINAEADIRYLFGDFAKPTRWQRVTFPIRWRWARVVDAWLVLIGRRDAC